jgi:hypothetical protein
MISTAVGVPEILTKLSLNVSDVMIVSDIQFLKKGLMVILKSKSVAIL